MIEKKIAEMLDKCEYGEENHIKRTEGEQKTVAEYAKEHDAVIVFGASDDLMVFRGAIDTEIEAYGEVRIWLDTKGILENKCVNDECPYFEKERANATIFIDAEWCKGDIYSWTYSTNIAHEEFDVLEEGTMYCRGIAFTMKALAIAQYE